VTQQSNKKIRVCTHMHFVKVVLSYVRFPSVCEIDTVVFWNITPCNFIGDCQCFGGMCMSYLQKRSPWMWRWQIHLNSLMSCHRRSHSRKCCEVATFSSILHETGLNKHRMLRDLRSSQQCQWGCYTMSMGKRLLWLLSTQRTIRLNLSVLCEVYCD
jgi:hypothetical protein